MLMDRLCRLFNSPQYSDLKIKSGDGAVYHVHKSIVCTQSAFFANACNREHGFKVREKFRKIFHSLKRRGLTRT